MENKENKMVVVTNRNVGMTSYYIPEANIKRRFAPQESKRISLDELTQLSYITGGEYILKNCLIINDKDALSALNINVEPEYFYTEEEIKKILTSTEENSLLQLEDMLNFAPAGVIDLTKQIAVNIELPDTRKRSLITKMTGFNVDNAINVNHVLNAEDEKSAAGEPEKKVRKAAAAQTEPTRKTAPIVDKYKVVAILDK